MLMFSAIGALILLAGFLGMADQLISRRVRVRRSVTFLVPCFNSDQTVGQTVRSIFAIAGPESHIIVIDDGSGSECRSALRKLGSELGFHLRVNPRNLGKAASLNACAESLDTELVAFVDSDVVLNAAAFNDALARLSDPTVGAVSCPFRPINRGVIPLMQQIEYNVMRFVHGSYNLGSAIALWGGFILIKRNAFIDAGGFSTDAIVEDKDLAFKLNRCGWRVQQSFRCMETHVPETLGTWLTQKIRWSSGGAQCYFRHWRVWVRNPLHMLFLSLYFGAFGFRVWEAVDGVALWEAVIAYFVIADQTLTFAESFRLTYLAYGSPVRAEALEGIAYAGLSLPFVIPLLKSSRNIFLLLLFVPFSLLYIPAFTAVSVCGFIAFALRARELRDGRRAW